MIMFAKAYMYLTFALLNGVSWGAVLFQDVVGTVADQGAWGLVGILLLAIGVGWRHYEKRITDLVAEMDRREQASRERLEAEIKRLQDKLEAK